MLDTNITDKEKACTRILARLFGEGQRKFTNQAYMLLRDELGVDLPMLDFLLGMMKEYGAIEGSDPIKAIGSGMQPAEISPVAVKLARELDRQEKDKAMDLYESMKLTIRRNPYTAFPLMILIALVFVATAINQIGGALKFIIELFTSATQS